MTLFLFFCSVRFVNSKEEVCRLSQRLQIPVYWWCWNRWRDMHWWVCWNVTLDTGVSEKECLWMDSWQCCVEENRHFRSFLKVSSSSLYFSSAKMFSESLLGLNFVYSKYLNKTKVFRMWESVVHFVVHSFLLRRISAPNMSSKAHVFAIGIEGCRKSL